VKLSALDLRHARRVSALSLAAMLTKVSDHGDVLVIYNKIYIYVIWNLGYGNRFVFPRASCRLLLLLLRLFAGPHSVEAPQEHTLSRRDVLASKLLLIAGALAPASPALADLEEAYVPPGKVRGDPWRSLITGPEPYVSSSAIGRSMDAARE
jgi:hypothetical protein